MSETTAVPTRAEMPVEHTWDLTTVYTDVAAWEQDAAALDAMLPDIADLQGRVLESADTLQQALTRRDDIFTRLWQVYVYANHYKDSDSTDPIGQALDEKAGSLVARVSAAVSFIDPEILAGDREQVLDWVDATYGLHIYRRAIDELFRQRRHVRSAEVEEVMAQLSEVTGSSADAYSILTNADMRFPTIDGEDGVPLQLSNARYGVLMESRDRRVRRDAFKGIYSAYGGIRNTLGTTLSATVRRHVVEARLRNYGSALEAALAPNDIPLDVYHNLISTVNANLPLLHRYIDLRKKMLGLDDVHFYDLYVSLLPDVDFDVPYPEAVEKVSAAFAPLGSEYSVVLQRFFNERWIDVYENVGKRSGAYSGGSYSTAPFILLNYQDRLDDMYTLAHELGHSMHSYFTRNTQPPVYGDYTIFVAEVASTLNEALLTRYLLETSDDQNLRKDLIVKQIDGIRSTLIRQTMFAEFELDIHTRAEQGEPLTADALTERYAELVARYHGPGVVIDDELKLEWARIPHFYYNFYVYQYATGLSAALALSNQIVEEGQPAIDRYLNFLRSGSSKSSIELLKAAGVDMTSPAPVQAAMDRFAELLDELEALSA